MSDSNQNQDKWRYEQQREQRKARLAAMKTDGGGKKPIRTTNRLFMVITAVIVVVALLATGTWWAFSLGVPHRTVTAMTIGSTKITAAEFSYFYKSQLNYYSIDPDSDTGKSTLNQAYDETYPTVADYLQDQAALEMRQIVMLCEEAKANGVSLDDTDMETVDSYIASLQTSATGNGQTLDNYLISEYGRGIDASVMKKIIERYVLANKYSNEVIENLSVTGEDIESYYQDNKAVYDVVTYRSFYIFADYETDATDEEIEDAMKVAKATADEMFGKITDEASFKALCIEYAVDEEEELEYSETDASLVEGSSMNAITSQDQSAWLFDTARKSGDKTVIERADYGYYVTYFVERYRPDDAHVSVRHILISADSETAESSEIEAAEAKAEEILDTYLAGEQTADAFAALANEYSEDPGSSSTGGLYSDIAPGDGYVAEFLAWCVDPARQIGDTGIVQTEFGFHIMYFEAIDGIEWEMNVESDLVNQLYSDYLAETSENYPYALEDFGLRFVG